MSPSHTPGPWRVINDTEILAEGAGVFIVCEGYGVSARPHRTWDQEVRRNAQLIAAAPEMLAALKAALQYIVMCDGMVDRDRATADVVILEHIKRAISLAEGVRE